MALSSRPFCSCDSRQAGLWYLPARWRDTTHQDVEHVIILIHGAPQVMALPVHRQKDLVHVSFVAWLGASTLQPMRVVLPTLQTPLTDGLVCHIDTALELEFLHVAIA